MQLPAGVEITYLGHSTFRIVSPNGKVIVMEPWLENNPGCPEDLKAMDRCDICLITHGHFDHMQDALSLWQRTKCTFVVCYEFGLWLGQKGIDNAIGMGKGGTVDIDGIQITMVSADHSAGLQDTDGRVLYVGEPVGFIITLENGLVLYNAGDTGPFSDMKLIDELYQPSIAFLPIGDRFTAGPREAALMCTLMPSVKTVIPQHYATFPLLTGTPEKLRELVKEKRPDLEIVTPHPGETLKGA